MFVEHINSSLIEDINLLGQNRPSSLIDNPVQALTELDKDCLV